MQVKVELFVTAAFSKFKLLNKNIVTKNNID